MEILALSPRWMSLRRGWQDCNELPMYFQQDLTKLICSHSSDTIPQKKGQHMKINWFNDMCSRYLWLAMKLNLAVGI